MSEDYSSNMSESQGINNVDRRRVLESLGGAGVTIGAFSVVPGNAAAESDDLTITEVNDERAGRAVKTAKESKEFSKLLEKVRAESEHSLLLDESRVFYRDDGTDEFMVVAFPLSSPENSDDPRELRRGDIAVIVNMNYQVESGRANFTYDTDTQKTAGTSKTFSLQDGSVETTTQTVQSERLSNYQDSVSTQSSVKCSGCKKIYGVICDVGCNVGASTICYLVTGPYGAFCGGLVGDLCDFVDKNSCEQGLNRVVCEIIGFCPTNGGSDPCDQFPGGVDSPYCDA